jgi:hypothetical protein
VVGDTCVSEQGMTTIVDRDKRYYICGSAHGFFNAGELIRKHQPDGLLMSDFVWHGRERLCVMTDVQSTAQVAPV